ncbi:thiolase [Citrifermentans bemidjiense Bem]|uniref:Thiolase n=1 Tax=Citrifermentans bemidjiense (strain ATCC BAA-1014 / DSM 16622 / JCM 12645 / Bem) TaxID=404380 RepID=B5EDE4_CITBB|nr:thiolase family protein [Citrifermentans bemidjiense]ACH39140.1 thiolase [Citrifermentans bemidjiense Bem]
MRTAYIVIALRTPATKAYKGKLRQVRPDDLAAAAIKGVIDATGIDPAELDDIIIGCAFPEAEQGMNVARIAAFKAGVPYQVPCQTVNRFCSSGLQTIATAAERIMAGFADCIVAGGTESMSLIPMGGNKFSANPGLVHAWPETYASMGITAELMVEKYGVSREDQDAFAAASHQKAAQAIREGRFADEIVPVKAQICGLDGLKMKCSVEQVSVDDGVRADTTVAALAKLKPAFKANGSVTAGNSSQMTDGAAAALVVSEDFLKRTGLQPMARFVCFAVKGVPPEIMGTGPIEAIPAALKLAGLSLDQVSLFELNEAFAVQSLVCIDELKLDPERVNVNGGAIAMGHPLGCTGTKLTATLLHELRRRKERYGCVSMCIGGGMGAAGIFEMV